MENSYRHLQVHIARRFVSSSPSPSDVASARLFFLFCRTDHSVRANVRLQQSEKLLPFSNLMAPSSLGKGTFLGKATSSKKKSKSRSYVLGYILQGRLVFEPRLFKSTQILDY
jgi:hypothetical protein